MLVAQHRTLYKILAATPGLIVVGAAMAERVRLWCAAVIDQHADLP
jgi:hypothetical protein